VTPKLSIIIPCYNCERTLRQAVDSCYTQGFEENEFEVIMVDDGSTDGTRDLIKKLSTEHSNTAHFFHDSNQGGGAARNTGVQNSQGEVIFSLDSDDMLPGNSLFKMYSYVKEKNCDGVTVHRSIKFRGNDTTDIVHIDVSPYAGKEVPFTSFFSLNGEFCPLVVTFMYTREAFDKMGGYPTSHSSDTQGFAWRFICAGLKVHTCPEAEYLHRVLFTDSYYIREYNSGKLNYNWRDILLEHYYIFTPEALRFITSFDCSDFTKDLVVELRKVKNILVPNYELLLGMPRAALKTDLSPRRYINRNSFLGYYLRIRHKFTHIYMEKTRQLISKIKRYSYSLYVSLFTRPVNKGEFDENYQKMKSEYLTKKDTYDFAEFIVPQWRENMLEIERYFLNDFSFSFLNHRVIKNTMFMYTFKPWRDIEKKLIAETYSTREAKKILKEYNLGKPLLNDVEYVTSGNSIHHLYHFLKFFKTIGTTAKELNTVVEVGGGYGNAAKLYKELNGNATYTIIDIPIFCYIQAVYLQTVLGKDAVHMVHGNDLEIKKGKINLVPLDKNTFDTVSKNIKDVDLFLSTWALSESNGNMQALIKNVNFFDAKYLLLAHQKSVGTFAFAEDIKNLPDSYSKLLEEETEYVKDNYYLFAKHL
jgi:putative sugar O-methyltransferase